MIIDSLNQLTRYSNIPGIDAIQAFLARPDVAELGVGDYPLNGDLLIAKISKYETHAAETSSFETHQKYIDVQVILSGREQVNIIYPEQIHTSKVHDAGTDASFHTSSGFVSSLLLDEGHFMVFFPGEPHQPALNLGGQRQSIHKIVFKVSATLLREKSEG